MKPHITFGICFLLITSNLFASSTPSNRAATDIQTFEAAIENFKEDVGRYPTTEEGLSVLKDSSTVTNAKSGGYIKNIGKSPWGGDYLYMSPGFHNKDGFDLWFLGRDGRPGGEGFDSDCGNWPNGFDDCFRADKQAANKRNKEKIIKSLPESAVVAFILYMALYWLIGGIRRQCGATRFESLRGKTIWLSLSLFLYFSFITLPLLLR